MLTWKWFDSQWGKILMLKVGDWPEITKPWKFLKISEQIKRRGEQEASNDMIHDCARLKMLIHSNLE